MNILELIGVAALTGAVGAMALAFLCVHFDGSGEKPGPHDASTCQVCLDEEARR